MRKLTISNTSRREIGRQILIALDDETKVACIFDRYDLNLLIDSLAADPRPWSVEQKTMLADLKELRALTFGEPRGT
jgi:hypothetical protein